MDICLKIESLDFDGQDDPKVSMTLLPTVQPAPTVTLIQDSFCSFCLRERPLDGAFYGYTIENCPILRETMEDIFGPKFKLEKFSICTPCWNMVQLIDDFRTCCFEANSYAERIKSGLKSEDGWYTQDTMKKIESMHSSIRDQIERIKKKAAERVPKLSSINQVISVDDSDKELDNTNVVEHPLEELHRSKKAIEMIQEIDYSTFETSKIKEEHGTNEQQSTYDDGEAKIESSTPPELPTYSIKIEPEEPEETTSDKNSMQMIFKEQRSPILERVDNFVIKIEPEEPEETTSDKNSMQFPFEEQRSPLLVQVDNFVGEDTDEANNLPEIPIHKIKNEILLPVESMDAEYANQTTGLEYPYATENENLFTEISVENIKVEKDEVGEKIAKLLNARVSQCGRCGANIKYSRGLLRHVNNCKEQSAVGPDVMYTCQVCWASYRSKANFKAHVNQHVGNKPYKCRLQCKKHFFGLRGRLKHEENCNAFIGCSLCESTFQDKESLFAHIKSAHGTISFKCEICNIKFSNKLNFKRHCLKLHTEREGDFPCRRCSNHLAKTAYEANLHIKECVVNFTFDCVQCGIQLRNASLLKAHQATKAHQENKHGELKYSCNVCGKKYKDEVSVTRHQATHTIVKTKIPCPECHKQFSNPSNLKKHMKLHLLRPYPCPSCNKRFYAKKEMKIHAETGCIKGEDKLVCQYCSKKYVSRSSLEKHIEDKHSKHLRNTATDLESQMQEI